MSSTDRLRAAATLNDQLSEWQRLMDTPATLHPELTPYLHDHPTLGSILQHPLVYSVPHFPQLNASLNAQLAHKRARLATCLASQNWHSYVFTHERPHRLDAFLLLSHHLTQDPKAYWELVADIWTDSENVWQHLPAWYSLLTNHPTHLPHRHYLMSPEELATLDSLPPRIQVYRGWHRHRRNRVSLSWTLSREKASWFASRFSTTPSSAKVSQRTVSKEYVIACFSARGEEELLLDVVAAGLVTEEELSDL